MMLKSDVIVERLQSKDDPLCIIPQPIPEKLRNTGDASVDLRLGTWFLTLRHSKMPYVMVKTPSSITAAASPAGAHTGTPMPAIALASPTTPSTPAPVPSVSQVTASGTTPTATAISRSADGYEGTLTNSYYVPFGKTFILHPHTFVLGTTLEWIKLPKDLGAYVIGKSSLGRHGLIIATATGVHPGFTGCLTLEFRNVGEIPIELTPGMKVCQLFLHEVKSNNSKTERSKFSGSRKPMVTRIELDEFAKSLSADI